MKIDLIQGRLVWLFIIVGGGVLFGGIILAWRLLVFARFPTIEGTLLGSEVVCDYSLENRVGRLAVKFSYTVNGVLYISERAFSLCNSYSYRLATPLVSRRNHPEDIGKRLLVHYNPEQPEFAFLRNGPAVAVLLPIFVGLFFSLYGIYSMRH